ncbi:unnamed protein product [Paramecium pentaurelia]|uniref:Protein kinase domain-containing protein n=1 Tax=Paramecium pentaurelia TaxID=43138 RepID=A0A8S1XZZ8_9CILI|nr:unnamed protein product [Paramecium pentaurelia]
MSQENRTTRSSESDETQGYFDMANNNERFYSFEQRIALKLILENEETFILAQEVPYNISQIMNKRYLNENQPILGSGSFGTVFICWHLISKYLCAVKVHQRCQADEILQQVNEYKIQNLLNIKFPNSSLLLPDRVYVIQESINYFTTFAGMEIAYTTLDEYIAKVDIQYDEFISIYHQILQQILEMHSLRIAHRDIKLSNIMYTCQKGWLISDFGCAQFYENQKGKYSIQGTRQYLPPDLRNLLKYNFQQIECEQNLFDNDIYSFLLSMLKVYKKGSSIVQLQQMLDNDCLLQQMPNEFKIHGKSYNYIKLNVLRGMNKVPIQKQFEQEKDKLVNQIFEEKNQSSEYIIELVIKKLKLYHFSSTDIWHSYLLSPDDERNNEFNLNIQTNQEVNQILQKYRDLLSNDFKQVEDNSLLEIMET